MSSLHDRTGTHVGTFAPATGGAFIACTSQNVSFANASHVLSSQQ
jgi:hypothetical protein